MSQNLFLCEAGTIALFLNACFPLLHPFQCFLRMQRTVLPSVFFPPPSFSIRAAATSHSIRILASDEAHAAGFDLWSVCVYSHRLSLVVTYCHLAVAGDCCMDRCVPLAIRDIGCRPLESVIKIVIGPTKHQRKRSFCDLNI